MSDKESNQMLAAALSVLVHTRGRVKTKLTKFRTFLEKCSIDGTKIIELPGRLEKIEQTWSEFDKCQTEIEDLDDTDERSNERDEFEDLFHDTTARARALIPKSVIVSPPLPDLQPVSTTANSNNQTAVKLPVIDLPKYDGEPEKWFSFRDLFKSLIDNNPLLSNVQKLHHLRSVVNGAASKAIISLEMSDESYEIAWATLTNLAPIQKESHTNLRQLIDDSTQHLQALEKLAQRIPSWDALLLPCVLPKLDTNTKREWESERADKPDLPTMTELTKFLNTRCTFLEALSRVNEVPIPKAIASNNAKNNVKNNSDKPGSPSCAYLTTQNAESSTCPACQGTHKIHECTKFNGSTVTERVSEVKKMRLCMNCLRPFHGRNCTAGSCKKCKRYHHTLLHFGRSTIPANSQENNIPPSNRSEVPTSSSNSNASDVPINNSIPATTSYSHCVIQSPGQVLLSTATILIRDKFGESHCCRAFFDSGSQANFITCSLAKQLKLHTQSVKTPIVGISQATINSYGQAYATISSQYNAHQIKIPFLIVEQITGQVPTNTIQISELNIPSTIKLADPSFNKPGTIDILLGASIFWDLLCVGQIRLARDQPILEKTEFGWIIPGPIDDQSRMSAVHCHFSQGVSLQDTIEKFLKMKELQPLHYFSKEESICEEHYEETHKHDVDGDVQGRLIVQLPLKEATSKLGDSRATAMSRLIALEKKLARHPYFKSQYDEFMQEYLDLKHMTEVTDNQERVEYFLPHHGVIKEESTTTKLRVVFDGSCKTTSGVSLNDILLVGPTIQQDLISIVLRFRQHRYTMSADVAKMYRQIMIDPSQRCLQMILWRWKPSESVKSFELNTVTYGLASSYFLAIRSLHKAAIQQAVKYPKAYEHIISDFYVDDLLTGGDDIEEVIQLREDIIHVLRQAGFELRKWNFNHPDLNPVSSPPTDGVVVPIGKEIKTLGLIWNAAYDKLYYRLSGEINPMKATKREILSVKAQIFDPLGLVGPVIIRTKIILQRLSQLGLGWDESLPINLHTHWTRWCEQIHHINNLEIPRHVICKDAESIESHGFCDAPQSAYGACIYVRSTSLNQRPVVNLLCAKSRVAPSKNISISRLELCGALLLIKLMKKVEISWTIPVARVSYWSDSTITLAWIAGEPCQWNIFVANRVAEVQLLTDKSQWHHVRTENNPAHAISRAINPEQIQNLRMWWAGGLSIR